MITANMICKNEENFIWFSIMSILDYVDEILIYDTGSTDKTIEIIETIKSDKIKLERSNIENVNEIVKIKNQIIQKSKSEWILILDADEIWTNGELLKTIENLNKIPKENNLVKVFRREIMPDFSITKRSKSLYAIRFLRNFTSTLFVKEYPAEILSDINGKRKIWNLDSEYYHFHNFIRSKDDNKVFNRIERMNSWWYQGEKEPIDVLPGVFLRDDVPEIVFENVKTIIRR